MKENSNTSNFTKNLLEECIHTAVELCMENISRQTSDFCLELAKELAEAAETKAKNIHVFEMAGLLERLELVGARYHRIWI